MSETEQLDQGMAVEDAEDNDDIQRLRAKVAEMEAQLKEETEAVEAQKEQVEAGNDDASIYIGQVDYQATCEELITHFAECGSIKRVTILCDKYTGPKGYAYMEFEEPSSVEKAVQLNESTFRGRTLKVLPKRTNQPGHGKKSGKKGGFKGYKGNWWDPYGAAFSPYAAAAAGKGKKGKKAPWYAGAKGGKAGKAWGM